MSDRIRVYMAGKIGKHDWRHAIVPNLRFASLDFANKPQDIEPLEWDGFRYSGPFFMRCDHGCYHGSGEHGIGAYDTEMGGHGSAASCMGQSGWSRSDAVSMCLSWLRQSEVVFCWMNDPTAYGTVAEIGYAKALGKPIWIFIEDRDSDGVFSDEYEPLRLDDLWFAMELATEVRLAKTPGAAWESFRSDCPFSIDMARRCAHARERVLLKWHPTDRARWHSVTTSGHVYVLRAGPYFKIGKAEVLDRRVKQLAIQLPERAVLWHSFKTDHMSLVENYFHAVFAPERQNGEWFALTQQQQDWIRALGYRFNVTERLIKG